MRRRLFIAGFFLIGALLISPLLYAQTESTVTGTIYNAKSGKTLSGANIFIPDSRKGTSSGPKGKYVLEIAPGTHRLVVSFIGFQPDTLKITVEPGENSYDARLQPELIEGEEVLVYSNRLERRVQSLADLRDEQRENLENYSATVHKLGLIYEIDKSSQQLSAGFNLTHSTQLNERDEASHDSLGKGASSLKPDSTKTIAFSERLIEQLYIAPRTYGEKYLARRSTDNFFSQYEVFSPGGSPVNLNDNKVELNILSENISVVGPISKRAPQFYELSDEPAGPQWPEGTTKITVVPESQIKPLFKGFVFIDEETDKIIGMDLKLNEAGNVFTGVYSFSGFSYYQRYAKVQDYWLPVRTEIEARVGITGLKNDFIYRDLWDYSNYKINRPEFSKDDIPLSGVVVADKADSRDKDYWMQTVSKYSKDVAAADLQKIMDYEEDSFLAKFITTSFRTFFRAPTFLRNAYFTNVSDFYRLNRVEGHYFGIGLRTPAVKENFYYKGAAGYATGADEFRYYTEALQSIPGTPLAVEGAYYNRLAIQFGDYRFKVGPLNIDEFTYTLQTAFSGIDTRNYFERQGYRAGLRWSFRDNIFLRANYLREDQTFLPVVAPQSLFNNFEVGGRVDSNLNPRTAPTPDGPAGADGLAGFTEGEFAGFEFQFHFDNRQFQRNSLVRDYKIRQIGWFTDHLAYWADPDFGSGAGEGFNYFKYRSSVGVRVPLFSTHFLLSEFFIGGADNPLPGQRQFGSNGFYIEDFLRRRPFLTLGFNEGVGNRISVARLDYDLGSSFFRILPINFIRQSGIQLRLYGSAGYRHDRADLRPVTPLTDGAEEHIEVGAAITRILGVFSIEGGVRLQGEAGEKVGLSLLF